jgi:hypothetical protein
MRTLTDQEMRLLRELEEAGIIFLVSPVFGYVELSADEVKTYMEDPDAFMARQHGVPIDLFRDSRATPAAGLRLRREDVARTNSPFRTRPPNSGPALRIIAGSTRSRFK